MIARTLLVLTAALAVQAAIVRRDAATPSPLDVIQKNAEEVANAFSTQLQKLANSKNTKELNTVITDTSEAFLKQVSALSSSVQNVLTDVDSKTKETLQVVQTDLQRALQELKTNHPDVEKKAAAIGSRLQTAASSTLQHTRVLAEEATASLKQVDKQVSSQVANAYKEFIKQTKEVQRKLEEASKQ